MNQFIYLCCEFQKSFGRMQLEPDEPFAKGSNLSPLCNPTRAKNGADIKAPVSELGRNRVWVWGVDDFCRRRLRRGIATPQTTPPSNLRALCEHLHLSKARPVEFKARIIAIANDVRRDFFVLGHEC